MYVQAALRASVLSFVRGGPLGGVFAGEPHAGMEEVLHGFALNFQPAFLFQQKLGLWQVRDIELDSDLVFGL